MNKILIVTEGNQIKGMGDVYGSLALGDELRKEAKVLFFVKNDLPTLKLIKSKNYPVKSYLNEEEIFKIKEKFNLFIFNKLDNNQEIIKSLKEKNKKIVTIDDTGKAAKYADLRVNVLYPVKNSISDLKYVILREEFKKLNQKKFIIKNKVEDLLIIQGGSDTYGFIPTILNYLREIPEEITINIVLGLYFNYFKELHRELDFYYQNKRRVNVYYNLKDIHNLFFKMDLAITACGNTAFELISVGVPSLLICGEKFEEITAKRLEMLGMIKNLGFGENLRKESLIKGLDKLLKNKKLRTKMSQIGKKMITGDGSSKIARKILNLCL